MNISLAVKIRLYESLVVSTLLYSAEVWPLSVTQMKKLEATHHKFQRRLLGITWRDKVRNEDIRTKTGSRKLEDIIKERRLRWLGHVLRMDDSRTARQARQWELKGYKRKPGRPRKNWVDVIKRDLKDMDLTWDEAETLADDKADWRQRVAQCTRLSAGWTKAKAKAKYSPLGCSSERVEWLVVGAAKSQSEAGGYDADTSQNTGASDSQSQH